jgi:hypothetical protein
VSWLPILPGQFLIAEQIPCIDEILKLPTAFQGGCTEDAEELHTLAHIVRERLRDEQRAAERRVRRTLVQLGIFRRDLLRVSKVAAQTDRGIATLHHLLRKNGVLSENKDLDGCGCMQAVGAVD